MWSGKGLVNVWSVSDSMSGCQYTVLIWTDSLNPEHGLTAWVDWHQNNQYSSEHLHKCWCSRTSKQATATGSKQQILSVAIHAVDSTIHHLDDSIVNKFVDPLKCVQDATQMIYKHPTISPTHRRLMLKQFSVNTAIATTFISLPDDNVCAMYVIDTVGTDNAMVGWDCSTTIFPSMFAYISSGTLLSVVTFISDKHRLVSPVFQTQYDCFFTTSGYLYKSSITSDISSESSLKSWWLLSSTW